MAQATTAIVLLLAAVAATQVLGQLDVCKNREPDQDKPHIFDLYKLTLHSKTAYCMRNPCEKVPKDLIDPHPPLTISTMATLNNDGSPGPTHCMDVEVDLKLLRSNTPVLEKMWPHFRERDSSTMYWQHQIGRYGTCAVCQDKTLNDGASYLVLALDMYTKYSVLEAFKKADIAPSNDKPIEAERLTKAFANAGMSGKVMLYCSGERRNGSDIIEEVSLCINPDNHELAACPELQETCLTPRLWYLGTLADDKSAGGQLSAGNSLVVMFSLLLAYLISRCNQ